MFFEQMHPTWQAWLADSKPLLEDLESLAGDIVPPRELVMRAFETDPEQIKAVILGQDPYPTPGDAIGLAFAMPLGSKTPRSLVNIVKELETDLGIKVSGPPDLTKWHERGVMLLNTSLTTLAGKPGAHSKSGWQKFTVLALRKLTRHRKIVLLAWGNHAQSIVKELSNLMVVESAHPSPLSASRGFLGSRPFSRANFALQQKGIEPIDWSL